jgi:hypothetical protein
MRRTVPLHGLPNGSALMMVVASPTSSQGAQPAARLRTSVRSCGYAQCFAKPGSRSIHAARCTRRHPSRVLRHLS